MSKIKDTYELYPLVDRLRCKYNGRDFGGKMEVVLPTAIMLEAADVITQLSEAVLSIDDCWDWEGLSKEEYERYSPGAFKRAITLAQQIRDTNPTEDDSPPWKE